MCKGLVVEGSVERPKTKRKPLLRRLGRVRGKVVQDEAEREMGPDHKEFLWPTVFIF